MDPELEEQIDHLVNKSLCDLKNRICKTVAKHQAKINKEHAREIKALVKGVPVKVSKESGGRKRQTRKNEKKSKSRGDESESDYYSE